MQRNSQSIAIWLAWVLMVVPLRAQDAKQAEPITLNNVQQVGLLSEIKSGAHYLELGPGPNELMLTLRDGIEVVDDKELKMIRRIDNDKVPGFTLSRDRSLTGWVQGKTAFIRDENTGKTLEIEAGELPGRGAFSPDNQVFAIGDMIITGSEGEGHSLLRVFDAKTGKLIQKFDITIGGYGALRPVFSPDGSILAVGNRNYETKLFDTKTWELRHTLPKRMTHEIAFSADGKTLAAGYVDGTIALWEVQSGKALHMVSSGCNEIYSVTWNPAGDLLATAGPTKVLLWDAKTFKVVKELMTVQWTGSVRFTADGTRLMSTVTKKNTLDDSPRIAVWTTSAPVAKPEKPEDNVPKLEVAGTLGIPAVAAPIVALSPEGDRLVAPLRNDRLAIWNLTNREQEFVMDEGHDWQIWRVAFSPDGLTTTTASLDKTAKIWNATTGNLIATLKGHTDRLEFVTYSPKGKYVFTSTGKTWPYEQAGPVEARVWNAQTGEQVAELDGHTDTITRAEFSRDETRVITASDDHTVRVWDAASGKELHMFDLESRIATLDFSPDGKTILTSSSGSRSAYIETAVRQRRVQPPPPQPVVKLWDMKTGKELLNLPHPQGVQASFNTAGDQILTETRGMFTYWDAATGKKLATLREPFIGTNVVFSPQGEHFVVLTPDQPAELWNVAEKRKVREMEIQTPFHSFFSPDGKTFYSLNRTGEFRWWSLDGIK